MRKLILILLLICFSCGKDKVVQLPEINHSEITEIQDVSAAYLFYDETQKDRVELNRKNLISTTNWLVNIDKRLTLKEAIPQIIFLQNKKRNAEIHKNNAAKNYYTCNDTTKKNLGFIEFTNVFYHTKPFNNYVSNHSDFDFSKKMKIEFMASEDINIEFPLFDLIHVVSKKSSLINDIKSLAVSELETVEIILCFNQNLTFQDYITFKSMLLNSDLNHVSLSNNEFIFN